MSFPSSCPVGSKYYYKSFSELTEPTGWSVSHRDWNGGTVTPPDNYLVYYENTGIRFRFTGGNPSNIYWQYIFEGLPPVKRNLIPVFS